MQPRPYVKTLAASSANNICLSQTPGAAGNLTINGSTASGGVATLDTQRQVLFTFAANETGHTFVVYGQSQSGGALQESVAGTTAGTVATTQNFYKVTRISISAAATGAITVGTNGVGATEWKIVNWHSAPENVNLSVVVSGTVNYTVQYTYDDPSGTYPSPTAVTTSGYVGPTGVLIAFPTAWSIAGLTNLAANADAISSLSVAAYRLLINSGTGTATLTIQQAGIADS